MEKFRKREYRMGTNKAKIKAIIGVFILVLAIVLMYMWETFGKQELTYSSVVVFKENIEVGETVSSEMLTETKIPAANVVEGVINNPSEIIGKETLFPIPKNMQLLAEFFEEKDLIIEKDEFVFSLPTDWVYSCPQTVRRGDTVYFYPVENIEDIDMEEVWLRAMGLVENVSEGAIQVSKQKSILDTVVAYVKDTTNREVVDISLNPREDASAAVAQIEVILTEDEYNILYEYYVKGNVFIILYN